MAKTQGGLEKLFAYVKEEDKAELVNRSARWHVSLSEYIGCALRVMFDCPEIEKEALGLEVIERATRGER